jgi:DNA-binding NarL/FixJ family response regulator
MKSPDSTRGNATGRIAPPSSSRARILVADDNNFILHCLRLLLQTMAYDVVDTVTNGEALVRHAAELRPDLIITDISMPRMDGIQAARFILQHTPEVPIIFLTSHTDHHMIRYGFEVGGRGYLVKDDMSTELDDAVKAVLKGKVYLSRSIMTPIPAYHVGASAHPHDMLATAHHAAS